MQQRATTRNNAQQRATTRNNAQQRATMRNNAQHTKTKIVRRTRLIPGFFLFCVAGVFFFPTNMDSTLLGVFSMEIFRMSFTSAILCKRITFIDE
jgi:hypothetical protein